MMETRKCNFCGAEMFDGMTDGEDFHCCDECFEDAMSEEFGEWRATDDDGCGGYYEWYDVRECEWCGTGIYYTDWS